ncbi:MAG: exodeoxyribonuclease V subunit gamma [Pyrinomonadaceae bacterium]|nr:exodeoxyribonuclease V subunit gamma [Pyrinomonadaceae bacterium]
MEKNQAKRIEVSSDAATRIGIAQEWIWKYAAETEILVIAHSVEAASRLHLEVVGAKGAWFGIKRFTLNVLASRLAQGALAESGSAPASSLSFTAVVARAIHSLQSEGKLSYFEPVATRPGFPVAVAKTLEELRMNEVHPKSLARLARGGKDLAAIAGLVEQELKESKLSDRAALFRAAIDSTRLPESAAYLGLPLLLLDVAARSRLESRLIQELAASAPDVLATVPQGDERTITLLEESLRCTRDDGTERGDGGTGEHGPASSSDEKQRSTKLHLERSVLSEADSPSETGSSSKAGLNSEVSFTSDVNSPSNANSLSFAKQHLFEDSTPPRTPLDSSILLRNWPGEPRESVEIVRSIQAEAAQGVPFDQIAVLLNSPGEYRSHLEEAFSRAEIPAYFVKGTTAPDPAGRAMLALLSCAADGLSARRFAEYLSLGQVPQPEASKDLESAWVGPSDELVASAVEEEAGEMARRGDGETGRHGDAGTRRHEDLVTSAEPADSPLTANPEDSEVIEGALRAPARWERLLVDSAVIGGKDRWTRRLEGLANELLLRIKETAPEEEAKVESIKKQLRDLEALSAYALPLIERLASLPHKGKWGEWLAHLRELAVNALREPEGVLATLADLEPMERVGPVELHEVQLVLGARLHDLGVKPPPHRYGSVFVGSVDSARGLSFRVVFIPGLAERIFPRKIVEDPILPDQQRRESALAGLMTRRDRVEFERLALRIALGAARERAYLSYPRIDVQQSRPRVPSFYALEALRAAESVLPGFEEIAARAESTTRARLGWPAPERPDAAIDEAEYDLALLTSLVEANDEGATGRAHYLLTANKHLARALRARSRRWLRRWTPNDGLVDPDELARQSMASHQFSARSFSATALQNYASCPYRFFLSAILRLEMRQEPAAIEVIDPLTRGSLFHETQFEVLTSLKAAGMLPLVGAPLRGRPLDGEERRKLNREEERTLDTEVRRVFDSEEWRGVHRDEGRAPTTDSISTAFDLVDRVLDRLAREYEDRLAPAIPKVWEDGINSIRADLREWLRRMADSDDGWVPEKFELSFGLTDRGPRDSDPDSVSDPVEIVGDFKLRGSIDLVERHSSGRFRVTDHKTGKARADKETIVGGGKYLQPLLYALAAQKALNVRVEAGRLYYCTAAGGYEERVVSLNDFTLQTVTAVLTTIRQGLADAFLPAAPEEGACGWCDFLAVCGSLEEIRTRNKPKDRLVQLRGIRELP